MKGRWQTKSASYSLKCQCSSLSPLQQLRSKWSSLGDGLLFITTHFTGFRSTRQTLPLQEMLVFPSVRKAGPSHPQVLHQPQVLDLMPYEEDIELAFGNTEGRVTVKDPVALFQPRQTRGCKLTICGLDLAMRHVLLGPNCVSLNGGILQESLNFWFLLKIHEIWPFWA